jgi:hypothetical protein
VHRIKFFARNPHWVALASVGLNEEEGVKRKAVFRRIKG